MGFARNCCFGVDQEGSDIQYSFQSGLTTTSIESMVRDERDASGHRRTVIPVARICPT